MQKIQEREKVRAEVISEFQASANNFVAQEIAKAKFEMEQELERRVQEAAIQHAMKHPLVPQFTPNVVNVGNGLQFPQFSTRIDFNNIEDSSQMEVSHDNSQVQARNEGPLASAKVAAAQRRHNQQVAKSMTNTIRNSSEEPAF